MPVLPGTEREATHEEERIRQLTQDVARLQRTIDLLDKVMLGIIECEDIILTDGTQATMRRVMELVKVGWLESEIERMATPEDQDRTTLPYCTKCQTYLSVQSQIAGYCIKCTHETQKR